jgi:hypothetical protein
MSFLVFSPVKPTIIDPHHTCHCISKAVVRLSRKKQVGFVITLILKKYQQSSNKFKCRVLRLIRMPVARYCLIVELVRVRSSIDS